MAVSTSADFSSALDQSELKLGKSSKTDLEVGCKFLTSPQLFALQLLDPAVRRQVLTQILIFTHSLRAQPISIVPQPVTGTKRTFGQAKEKEKSKANNAALDVFDDIGQIESRAFSLLSSTPPDGFAFVQSLKRLLDRELSWLEWKKIRRCLEVSTLNGQTHTAYIPLFRIHCLL